MKKHFLNICILIGVMLCTIFGFSQEDMIGYRINGDKLTFEFEVDDYPNIKNLNDSIYAVYVSGEFNDWATDHWKMEKITETLYELEKPLYEFTSDFDWEFKFVVNGIHWAEPSEVFKNITPARLKSGKPLMAYNLKLYSAFATVYGNVKFKLKGYKDAKKVLLSGTFNRWDETGFKMNKEADGWFVTLQLRPGVYQYKFIIDGQWIEDPQNPSKIENEFHGYNSVIDVKKTVTFELCDFFDAKEVILSGDFNDWDEDEFVMTKPNACWNYTVDLSGGKYHYKFIVDGVWMTDPFNSVVEYDKEGHINSVCIIK